MARRAESHLSPGSAAWRPRAPKFDAYAHHPYPSSPAETPSSGGCRDCPSITMATIREAPHPRQALVRAKPAWLTEYGYQTKPPDMFLGVPPKTQATLLSLAAMRAWRLPRVTMLIQYLYRDEPILSRFQSGLVFIDNRWKPSLQGFKLPFAQMGRRGLQAIVWGQIREGETGRKRYRLEVLRKNVWKPVGRARLTNDNGVSSGRFASNEARSSASGRRPAALQPAAAHTLSLIGDAVRRLRPACGISLPFLGAETATRSPHPTPRSIR